jgi:hypothetical protein
VEERLAAVVKESEIVIEKLRARLDEMREDKATHLTLDEVFDLVKELNHGILQVDLSNFTLSLQRPPASSAHDYIIFAILNKSSLLTTWRSLGL